MAETCTGSACNGPPAAAAAAAAAAAPLLGLGSQTLTVVATLIITSPLLLLFVGPRIIAALALYIGSLLRKKTEARRQQLVGLMNKEHEEYLEEDKRAARATSEASETDDWDGIIGFFHPFCNAGGGGERVLWAAIRATQSRWPRAKCIVYTGDRDATKTAILSRVRSRFNIHLHPPTVQFLYLSKRHWVLASTWPHFTLLGQSLGSMVLAWDAFSMLTPDVFVDTMGYAFALGLCRLFFPEMPTGAYVHYPTISTDMLQSLDPSSAVGSQGVNAGQGTGLRGSAKRMYWELFAQIYSWVGSSVNVVMTNSSWTQGHIEKLWGPFRQHKAGLSPLAVVYPPVAVTELEQEIEVSETSEQKRQPVIICIAQFRPEKNHQLVLQSFADFVKTKTKASETARLVLLGSVRDDADSKRVYKLRLMANELGIKDRVEFQLNASWPQILEWLGKASVGVNAMWNEHFGIGVVEYQAAGLISVVHNSGGPKLDIVTTVNGEPTGFHAATARDFASGYEKALSTTDPLAIRLRARQSAKRFTEEEFAKKWLAQMERLLAMSRGTTKLNK